MSRSAGLAIAPWALLVAIVGCAPASAPIAPAAKAPTPRVAVEPPAPIHEPAREPAPPEPAPPEKPARPVPRIEIEQPFRLDKRVVPKGREAFLAHLRERERWNAGGLGELAKPAPEVAGHPMPRVIVDVSSAKGGHKAADLQRTLRKLFWIRIIHCYELGAHKDQALKGKTTIRFHVARSGKVPSSRLVASTLKDAEVAACLAAELKKIPLPSARSSSIVTTEVQISPGDEPMPPPAPLLLPGEGTVDREAVEAVVRAALPAFEACYETALDYAPLLWGRLGIRFHQTDKGKLDEAFEAESRFPDERVTHCVLRAARGLKFPKPTGGEVRFIVALRLSTDRAP
jgi:hypothetical protein